MEEHQTARPQHLTAGSQHRHRIVDMFDDIPQRDQVEARPERRRQVPQVAGRDGEAPFAGLSGRGGP